MTSRDDGDLGTVITEMMAAAQGVSATMSAHEAGYVPTDPAQNVALQQTDGIEQLVPVGMVDLRGIGITEAVQRRSATRRMVSMPQRREAGASDMDSDADDTAGNDAPADGAPASREHGDSADEHDDGVDAAGDDDHPPDVLHVHFATDPSSEYNKPELWAMGYPLLFPFGIGGADDPHRRRSATLPAWVKHCLLQSPSTSATSRGAGCSTTMLGC